MSVNVGESINERKKKGLQWSTAVLTPEEKKKQLTAEHTQKETQYTDMKKTVSLVNIDQK